jgi:hypothetical protein
MHEAKTSASCGGDNVAPVSHVNEGKLDVSHVEQDDRQRGASKPGTFMETYRSYTPEFTTETERKLLRKIDSRLMPLVVLIYLFNYLDRNSITQVGT